LVEGVHEKPMEPGVETLRILQLGKLAPRQQERLLDGILGPLDIAKDPVCDGAAAPAGQVDKRGEGELVAIACPFDQSCLHG
jgi:hypothetical protein